MWHLHTDGIEAYRLSCVLALKKAELLQNLFLRSSNSSSLLPVLEKQGCWWSRLLASHWPHSLAPIMAVWAVSKAWRCVQACTSVHNCAQSLLFPSWDRLWKMRQLKAKKSICIFMLWISKQAVTVDSPNAIFCFYQPKNTSAVPLPLDPLTGDLEVITARLCLHPGHQFKALGISHPLKSCQGSTVCT